MAGQSGRANPRSTPASARKGKSSAAQRKTAKPSVLGRVFAQPGMIVAGATFAAVMTGIVANALLLQKGHHPSPLFSPAPAETAGAEPARPAAPVLAPTPVSRQVLDEPATTSPEPEAATVPKAAAPITAPAPVHLAPKPQVHSSVAPAHAATPSRKPAAIAPHRDPITQLLSKQDHKTP